MPLFLRSSAPSPPLPHRARISPPIHQPPGPFLLYSAISFSLSRRDIAAIILFRLPRFATAERASGAKRWSEQPGHPCPKIASWRVVNRLSRHRNDSSRLPRRTAPCAANVGASARVSNRAGALLLAEQAASSFGLVPAPGAYAHP